MRTQEINPKLNKLKDSASMAVAAVAATLSAEGRDIVSLAIGDTHFSVPNSLQNQMEAAIREGRTHYGSAQGVFELRSQIVNRYLPKTWSPDDVLVVPGVKQGLFYIFWAIAPREICILEPAWLGYSASAKLVGSDCRRIDTTNADWLQRVAESSFDVLIYCSPNNPDGKIMDEQEIHELVTICESKNSWIIADEIYSEFDYLGSWKSLAECTEYERVVICNGFSKSHAMTGLRVGWIAMRDRQLYDGCFKLQQHIATCPNTPSQHALVMLAGDLTTEVANHVEYYQANRDFVAQLFPEVRDFVPDGGFYYFFPITNFGYTDCQHFSRDLLCQQGVAVVPGASYGVGFESFVRLSFSVDRSTLENGLHRLREFIDGRSH